MALDSRMAEALRLTRAGDLLEATELIQNILSGRAPAGARPATAPAAAIDLTPMRVKISPTPGATKVAYADPADAPASSFVARRYHGAAGTLDYLLYVPEGATAGMPLVTMLHGCTQSPEDFAGGTGMNRLADELGFLVLYPRQTQSANAQKCWNWFRPGDQQRDRGEPALIAGAVRDVLRQQQADARRVYVAGLSAGGAAAAILAAHYPDLFAAVGIHSGLGCGAARDLPGALSAMRKGGGTKVTARSAAAFVPTITFHGDRDATVHEINGREIATAASTAFGAALDTRVETSHAQGRRSYSRETSTDASGAVQIEHWTIHGAGHAWSGGAASGTYTDPTGPEASREMLRFFFAHKLASRRS